MAGLNIIATLGLDAKGFKAGAEQARQSADKMKKHVGKQFKTLGVGMAKMFAFSYLDTQIRETVEYASKVRGLAKQFGMTTDQIQKLDFASKQNGITIEETMDAHKDLAKNTAEALMGVTSKVDAFKVLGISVNEIAGKNIDQIFMRVAKSIRETGPILQPEQVKAIEDLMGGAGFKAINLMRSDLEGVFSQLEEMGALLEEEGINKMAELNSRMDAFNTRNRSMWADMLGVMGGAFMTFVDAISSGVDKIAERFVSLGGGLKNMGFADGKLFNWSFGGLAEGLAGFIGGDTGKAAFAGAKELFAEGKTAEGVATAVAGTGIGLVEGTFLAGDVRRDMARKKQEEDALLALDQKGKDQEAKDQAAAQNAKLLLGIAQEKEKLDKAAADRQFKALSASEKQVVLEAKIAAKRRELSQMAFFGKGAIKAIKESTDHTDEEKQQKILEMEQADLQVAKKRDEITQLLSEKEGYSEKANKETKGEAVAMAGEAKFDSLARIGGTVGGRNPVLDTAKKQLSETAAVKEACAQTARAVQVLAGVK